jgi:hypothetical protein
MLWKIRWCGHRGHCRSNFTHPHHDVPVIVSWGCGPTLPAIPLSPGRHSENPSGIFKVLFKAEQPDEQENYNKQENKFIKLLRIFSVTMNIISTSDTSYGTRPMNLDKIWDWNDPL